MAESKLLNRGQWVVYMLRCKDDTLYTGITCNLSNRLSAHRSGKGAKYTRGRSPLTLCYLENCPDKSIALQRELEIKKLTREEKIQLISAHCVDFTKWN